MTREQIEHFSAGGYSARENSTFTPALIHPDKGHSLQPHWGFKTESQRLRQRWRHYSCSQWRVFDSGSSGERWNTLTHPLKTAQQWMYALCILIIFSLTHLKGYTSHNRSKQTKNFCWSHKDGSPKWAGGEESSIWGTTGENLLYFNRYSKGEEMLHH